MRTASAVLITAAIAAGSLPATASAAFTPPIPCSDKAVARGDAHRQCVAQYRSYVAGYARTWKTTRTEAARRLFSSAVFGPNTGRITQGVSDLGPVRYDDQLRLLIGVAEPTSLEAATSTITANLRAITRSRAHTEFLLTRIRVGRSPWTHATALGAIQQLVPALSTMPGFAHASLTADGYREYVDVVAVHDSTDEQLAQIVAAAASHAPVAVVRRGLRGETAPVFGHAAALPARFRPRITKRCAKTTRATRCVKRR